MSLLLDTCALLWFLSNDSLIAFEQEDHYA